MLTVGVEEEYQLVDPDSGALQSRARAALEVDWSDEVQREVHQSTLEINTRICSSAAELRGELERLRLQTATAAAAEGLEIVAAGLHPTSNWRGHRLSEGWRYRRIADEFGRIIRDKHIFGMHVHVGAPTGEDCFRLLDTVRYFTPHLLALSASSPFHEGVDTGFASYRAILWRRMPYAGVPPHFRSRKEYRELIRLLLRTGAIFDERNIYWSIRPHPEYPTLEFRVTDVCPRLDDAVAIAALVRAIVAGAIEGVLMAEPWPTTSTDLVHTLLSGNEWRAARHGLETELVDPTAASGTVPIRQSIRRLLDRVAPIAERLGDADAILGVETILRRGNGADRARAVLRDCGEFPALIAWLAGETLLGLGLDRRRRQRDACA